MTTSLSDKLWRCTEDPGTADAGACSIQSPLQGPECTVRAGFCRPLQKGM